MVNTILAEDIEASKQSTGELMNYLKQEQNLDDFKKLRQAYEVANDEISTMKGAIDDLYSQTDVISDISQDLFRLKSETNQLHNSYEQSKFVLILFL